MASVDNITIVFLDAAADSFACFPKDLEGEEEVASKDAYRRPLDVSSRGSR
jgi:hypothetical protein